MCKGMNKESKPGGNKNDNKENHPPKRGRMQKPNFTQNDPFVTE